MTGNRIEWIDSLKGFGIFLVFLGHTTLINKYVDHYVFSFHMPLFFFISGMFYKAPKASIGFSSFILTKINTRMVPYLLFGLLTYCVWLLPILLRKYGVYQGEHPIPDSMYWKPLVGMFYGIGDAEWLPHNTLLWFLACIFIVEIIFYLVCSVVKTKRYVVFVLLLSGFLGYLDSVYLQARPPFSIDVALTAVVFYGVGYLLRDYLLNLDLSIVNMLLCLLFGLSLGFLNGRVDMNLNIYGNPVLFYASAFLSIFGYVGLVKRVRSYKMVNYVGMNSLSFFLLQNVGFLVLNAAAYLMFHIRPHSMEPNLVYACCYVLLSILVLFPVVFLIKQHAPVMTRGFRLDLRSEV